MRNFVVIGCGRFGSTVAKRLYELGQDVMAVDKDEELINRIAPNVTTAVVCDVTDENAVKELGLSNFDVAIVSVAQNLEAEILAVLSCKEANIKKIVAKASNNRAGEILSRVGADKIIEPEKEMGHRLADILSGENIIDSIEFSKDYSIVEVEVDKNWIGKKLMDLKFREKYKCSILFIQREKEMFVNPSFDFIIEGDDLITVLGENKYINKIKKTY